MHPNTLVAFILTDLSYVNDVENTVSLNFAFTAKFSPLYSPGMVDKILYYKMFYNRE